MLLVGELMNADQGRNLLPLLQGENIGDRFAPSRTTHFGNLIHLLHIHPSRTREEHQIVVCRGREKVLHKVGLFLVTLLLLRLHSYHTFTTPLLRPITVCRSPLDVPRMGQGDESALLRNQILNIDLPFVFDDLGTAFVCVLFLNFQELFLDNRIHLLLAREDAPQLFDLLNNRQILFFDLVTLQTGQLIESQLKNCIRLPVAQLVLSNQLFLRGSPILRSPDDLYEVVQMIERLLVPLEDVGPILRHLQVKLGSPNDHFPSMLEITDQHLAHRE